MNMLRMNRMSRRMSRGRLTTIHQRLKNRCHRAKATMLLEVLLAVGLLVFGFAVVGLRVNTALYTAQHGQSWTTSMLLAETVMAKLQGGDIKFNPTETKIKGHFKIFYPGYSWLMWIHQCDIKGLYLVTLQIGYNEKDAERQKSNPSQDIDFEDQDTKILRTLYRLVPLPADLNLARDMGYDPEELQMDAASGGDGSNGGNSGGDPNDPKAILLQAVKDFLAKHPDLMTSDGSIDLNAITQLQGSDFDEAMLLVQQLLGSGVDLNNLKDDLADSLPDIPDDGALAGLGGGSLPNGNGNNSSNNGNTGGNQPGGSDGNQVSSGGNRPGNAGATDGRPSDGQSGGRRGGGRGGGQNGGTGNPAGNTNQAGDQGNPDDSSRGNSPRPGGRRPGGRSGG